VDSIPVVNFLHNLGYRPLGSVDIWDCVILSEVRAKNLHSVKPKLVNNAEILRRSQTALAPQDDMFGEMSTRPRAYLDNLQAKVEAVQRHQAATAAKLDALLPSILDKALKGGL